MGYGFSVAVSSTSMKHIIRVSGSFRKVNAGENFKIFKIMPGIIRSSLQIIAS